MAGQRQTNDIHSLHTPAASHRRPATCEEVECPDWQHGWMLTVDTRTPLGQRQRDYIVSLASPSHKSHRRFTQLSIEEGKITFTFEAGQACFRQDKHRATLERAPFHRINTKPVGNTEWMDSYQENAFQYNLKRSRGQ